MKIQERTLLIVDDEPDIFWVMEHLLKQEGLDLIRALNGQETLVAMKKKHFELVLLDAKLPDIEGLALAKKIKEMDSTVPIVLISGYLSQDDEIVQNSLSSGLISEYISKPFQHTEILNAVKNLLL
ncbi:MAG: response regulator [Desulfobacteraceae bacterium]|nr:MAG: response regulator [Desulfobacteraceae bacterium]